MSCASRPIWMSASRPDWPKGFKIKARVERAFFVCARLFSCFLRSQNSSGIRSLPENGNKSRPSLSPPRQIRCILRPARCRRPGRRLFRGDWATNLIPRGVLVSARRRSFDHALTTPYPCRIARRAPAPDDAEQFRRSNSSSHPQNPSAKRRTGQSRLLLRADHAVSKAKPSSAQPVTPPIITFTGMPSLPRRSAALSVPLQCGPAQ